jgi:hypothetical protein
MTARIVMFIGWMLMYGTTAFLLSIFLSALYRIGTAILMVAEAIMLQNKILMDEDDESESWKRDHD